MEPVERFHEDDSNGTSLVVYDRPDGKATLQLEDHGNGIACSRGYWIADPLTAPDLLRAICEASGTLPPVMLGRPEVPADGSPVDRMGFRLRADGGKVQYEADRTGELYPGEARALAAMIVALADSVRPEPDPGDVDELAKVMRLAIHPGSGRLGLGPTDGDRTAAAAALKWMRDRGEAGRG